MKENKKNKVRALGLFGFISASIVLAQVASAAEDSSVQAQAAIATDAGAETLPAENKNQLQDSITALQKKYDAETLSTMVLQIQDGKVVVVGVAAPLEQLENTKPSGLKTQN